MKHFNINEVEQYSCSKRYPRQLTSKGEKVHFSRSCINFCLVEDQTEIPRKRQTSFCCVRFGRAASHHEESLIGNRWLWERKGFDQSLWPRRDQKVHEALLLAWYQNWYQCFYIQRCGVWLKSSQKSRNPMWRWPTCLFPHKSCLYHFWR